MTNYKDLNLHFLQSVANDMYYQDKINYDLYNLLTDIQKNIVDDLIKVKKMVATVYDKNKETINENINF